MKAVDPDELATGLIRVAENGRIQWLNRAATTLLGPAGASLRNQPIDRVSPALAEWLARVLAQGRTLQAPEASLEGDDRIFDVCLQPDGDSVVIELHPVSERVRQRELAEQADRRQALSLMARQLAHELRNPLAGVRGAAQLIAARKLDETSGRHAAMIQREVDRITALIDRFAHSDRRASGPVNLHRTLTEAAELVIAEQHGRLCLEQDFDPSIPELSADGGQLHQLFLNLMRNSAQAGATTIRASTRIEHHSPLIDRPGGHAVRVDIEDDGQGVPEDLRERLFLPLATGRDQGSGFGLAIVQQIARAHGGLVEYQSLEHGSRFCLRLPLKTAAEPSRD